MKKFVTVHVVNVLPLHNLNRDQNGLPKSQFDGGVQRARLSAQSLKRAARVAYRDLGHDESLRTRQAIEETLKVAVAYATQNELPFDEAAGKAAIKKVIDGLFKSEKKTAEKQAAAEKSGTEAKDSENIIFLSRVEIATLAHATVDKQQNAEEPTLDDVVADVSSPSLDIAAFGRMFASAPGRGTHAAIAVSHAATTHQMALTADYFSAVEDGDQAHAGAGHIGMSYYTSGVYYRSFTIDTDQLNRSWSIMHVDGARETLGDLVKSLIRALPSGRSSNSNPYTTPALVLVETQDFRTAYEFDAPVEAAEEGGYKEGTIRGLAAQRGLALSFDPNNFGPALALGETYGENFLANEAADLDALAAFVVAATYGDEPGQATA